jgi:hypothetical protein
MVWFRGYRKSGSFAVGCVLGLGVRLGNSPAQFNTDIGIQLGTIAVTP